MLFTQLILFQNVLFQRRFIILRPGYCNSSYPTMSSENSLAKLKDFFFFPLYVDPAILNCFDSSYPLVCGDKAPHIISLNYPLNTLGNARGLITIYHHIPKSIGLITQSSCLPVETRAFMPKVQRQTMTAYTDQNSCFNWVFLSDFTVMDYTSADIFSSICARYALGHSH